jgi:hypothetical protein
MKTILITTVAVLLPMVASAAEIKAPAIKVTPVAAVMPAASAASRLPSIESLTKDSDYIAFMQSDVPVELHRAALRKLWSFQSDAQPAVSGGGAF